MAHSCRDLWRDFGVTNALEYLLIESCFPKVKIISSSSFVKTCIFAESLVIQHIFSVVRSNNYLFLHLQIKNGSKVC